MERLGAESNLHGRGADIFSIGHNNVWLIRFHNKVGEMVHQ